MPEPTSDKHYEEKFEYPLLKLIRQRAEEKDISYSAAADEVLPDYVKDLRYWDTEFVGELIQKRMKEMAELREREAKEKELQGA